MCSPLLSSGHVTSQLFEDKNTIVNIINTSHSIRLRKIDKRESDMLCNIYQWQISEKEKVRDPHTQGDGPQTGLAQVAETLCGETLPDLCWSPLCSRDLDTPTDSLLGFNLSRFSRLRVTETVPLLERSFASPTLCRRSWITE